MYIEEVCRKASILNSLTQAGLLVDFGSSQTSHENRVAQKEEENRCYKKSKKEEESRRSALDRNII